MSQSATFTSGEGDAWFKRNRDKLGVHDPVSHVLEYREITPTSVLEVGCANGWRLLKLQERHGCRVSGIDPSWDAVHEACEAGLDDVCHGTAKQLPWIGGQFDTIIYGFCLYLTDPCDWWTIASEANRLLKDGGNILIHDFSWTRSAPFARPYEHRNGVFSYHVDFARLWAAHPWYSSIYAYSPAGAPDEVVWLLRKNINSIPVIS